MNRRKSESAIKRNEAMKNSSLPSSFNWKIRQMFVDEVCPVCNYRMSTSCYDEAVGWLPSRRKPSVQHNTPISLGGKHELDNISVICHSCNISLQTKLLGDLNNEEVKQKWLKRNTTG